MKKTILAALILSQFGNALAETWTPMPNERYKAPPAPTTSSVMPNTATNFERKMWNLIGDRRFVKNQQGEIILGIPAGEAADIIYKNLGHNPQVWASYNPAGAIGQIQVVRAYARPSQHGGVDVTWSNYSPDVMGPSFKKQRYYSVDPFAQFQQGDNLWHNINTEAFLVMVGMAMQKFNTADGWVSIPIVESSTLQDSGGDLFTSSTTTTVQNYVHPMWLRGLPGDIGGKGAMTPAAYKIPGCYPIGEPIPPGEKESRRCLVKPPANFVVMRGGNMPENKYLADTQTQTQSGMSLIGQIVLTGVLVGLTAGAGGAALGNALTLGGQMTASLAGVAGSGAYAVFTSAFSNGGGCLTCQQSAWGGAVTNGSATPQAGGFGDPTAAVTNTFVRPGVAGAQQAGQADMWNKAKPKTWGEGQDPQLLRQSPPQREGVLNGVVN